MTSAELPHLRSNDRPHVVILGAGFGGLTAAKQMGEYCARAIAASVAGHAPLPAFRYRDHGNLATIGRKRAVADLGWMRLRGPLAWLLWCVAHIFFLVGFRNRLAVGANWLWHYVTFDRGARLITGLDGGAVFGGGRTGDAPARRDHRDVTLVRQRTHVGTEA